MKQRPRIYYTATQKALMWERWQKGDNLHQIAQLFDRGHSSIQRILAESGGIRPLERTRSVLSLTLAEREEISRGQARGALKKELMAYLCRTRIMRRSRHHTLKDLGLGKIANAVSIRERPAEAEDRTVPGYWEGDLLYGDANTRLLLS